jgi:ADP-heptose:LPS heptosyltransferase
MSVRPGDDAAVGTPAHARGTASVARGAAGALRRGGRRLAAGALEVAVRGAAALVPGRAEAPLPPRSLFVLRNNDVGDLLVVTPLFDALRRRFPDAWIAAGIGNWNLPVLRHNPHVSEVLAVNAPWFNKYTGRSSAVRRWSYLWRSPEVREVARHRFEIGIDVLGSGWGSLLMSRAGIRYRLGVRGFAGGHSALQAAVPFDPRVHVGRAALAFAELLGATDLPPCRPQLFLAPDEIDAAERWWAADGGGARRPRVVIGPGGGVAARCWPAESFAGLAAGLAQAGDLELLVLGGERDRDVVAAVAAAAVTAVAASARGRSDPAAARCRSLSPPPGLREVFALVSASDLVLCNSSMLLHVAAAFAKPAVVFLGRAFPSASRHQDQWGYPGISHCLGREPGVRDDVCTSAEALQAARIEIARLAESHRGGSALAAPATPGQR